MISGASLVGFALAATAFGPVWKLQFASLLMMGWGFYMIHGCLQVFASELSVEARATALSLHSFFFSWGRRLVRLLMASASSMPARCRPACSRSRDDRTGFACARLLRQSRPGDAARRPDVAA